MEYCYAVCFSNGVVKFGRTSDLHSRLHSHVSHAASHDLICMGVLVSGSPDSKADEAVMLRFAKSLLPSTSSGNEYFKANMEQAFTIMCKAGLLPVPCHPETAGNSLRFSIARFGMDMANFKIVKRTVDRDIKEAIIERLVKSPLGFGVICNRMRHNSRTEVAEALDELCEEGTLTYVEITHPTNKRVSKVYRIAG